MANPHKGEVEFEAGERRHTLRFSIDAMCGLEAEFKLPLRAILAEIEDGRVTAVRSVFRACLDDGKATVRAVTEIMDEISFEQAVELLSQAINLARSKREEANGNRPPLVTMPLTGIDSSSSGSPPAAARPRSGKALSPN